MQTDQAVPRSPKILMAMMLGAALLFPLVACGSSTSGSADRDDDEPRSVSEILDLEVAGRVQVRGLLFDDGSGLLICDALAESFPPQCPGASIAISNPEVVEADFTAEGSVSWTDSPIILSGDLVDGDLQVVG